ncbi:hypothetical protein V3C99_007908, partial [Haemonchus contortus]
MSIGQACPQVNINVEDTMLENVDKFTYLGSTITHDGDVKTDVCSRTPKATDMFRRLQSVWSLSSISRNIKIRLYSSIVIPTAIYASETWKYMAMLNFNQKDGYFPPEMSAKDHEDTAHGSRHDKEVLRRSGMNSLHVIVARRRLRLAGHVLRMSQQR